MSNDDILDAMEHKDTAKYTTSRKMKKNILETFRTDEYKDKIAIEIGACQGHSTRMLSYIFKKVIAVEWNDWNLEQAISRNKDRTNVEFVKMDLYKDQWENHLPSQADVFFIDAGHQYYQVKSDIENILRIYKDPTFIFDDYGLPPGDVKKAIDEQVANGNLRIDKWIGEEPEDFKSAVGTKIFAKEGCICNLEKIKKEKKNIVFIVNIGESDRSGPYRYSIDSWYKWSAKNNCELFTLTERIYDKNVMNPNWHKMFVFDLLDNEGIEYDQVLTVDADTIPHPDCPNFFDLSNHKYCAVHNDGSYDWVIRSIENYSTHLFDGLIFPVDRYINSGFIISNASHKKFYKKLIDFYFENTENIKKMQNTFHVGTDQPVINFLLNRENIDYKILPYEFNMQDMARKEILDEDLTFTKLGWVYHYNAIPQQMNRPAYWMEKTYNHLYNDNIT